MDAASDAAGDGDGDDTSQAGSNTPKSVTRSVREARLAFADIFGAMAPAQPADADVVGEEADHDGAAIDRILQTHASSKKDIVAMPYDNVAALHEDNLSDCDYAALAQDALGLAGGDPEVAKAKLLRRRPSWMKWVITLIASVFIALQCACMLLAEAKLAEFKYKVMWSLYFGNSKAGAIILFLGYGLCATFAASLLVLFVSPRAASSGIPDMKAYLNGNYIPDFLSFRTWLARTVGLILTTSAGLFSGSEGPLIAHLGAIVASGVARGRFEFRGKRRRLPWKMAGHRAQCEFIALGAAVGVAGAFGAPVGGVLWSFEEAASYWPTELTWRAFFGCAFAAALAKATKNGFVRFPATSFIEFPDTKADFEPWELFNFALIGAACGLFGACFCRGCWHLGEFRKKVYTKGNPRLRLRVAEVLVMALFILLACLIAPFAWGCTPLVPAASEDGDEYVGKMTRAQCSPDEYSDVATLVLQPKHKAIKALFTQRFEGGAFFAEFSLVFTYGIAFLATLLSFGMAMPFGLFVPHIYAGACLGRLAGQMVKRVYPEAPVHLGVYALVGAAGQLAGICRMTVSLTMIMVEITNNMRLMVPVMLCIMVSKFVADFFGPSAFQTAIELNPLIRMIQGDWQDAASGITLQDVCTKEVVVLHSQMRIGKVVAVLNSVPFQMFPIVDGPQARLLGIISRERLVHAAKKGNAEFCDGDHQVQAPGSGKIVRLTPYADMTPEVKHSDTPITRALNHFRSMGLQYLCVVGNDHGLRGIVTRTDLAKLCNARGRRAVIAKWAEAKPAAPPRGVPKSALLTHQRALLSPASQRVGHDSGSSSSGSTPRAASRSSSASSSAKGMQGARTYGGRSSKLEVPRSSRQCRTTGVHRSSSPTPSSSSSQQTSPRRGGIVFSPAAGPPPQAMRRRHSEAGLPSAPPAGRTRRSGSIDLGSALGGASPLSVAELRRAPPAAPAPRVVVVPARQAPQRSASPAEARSASPPEVRGASPGAALPCSALPGEPMPDAEAAPPLPTPEFGQGCFNFDSAPGAPPPEIPRSSPDATAAAAAAPGAATAAAQGGGARPRPPATAFPQDARRRPSGRWRVGPASGGEEAAAPALAARAGAVAPAAVAEAGGDDAVVLADLPSALDT